MSLIEKNQERKELERIKRQQDEKNLAAAQQRFEAEKQLAMAK